MYSFCLFYYYCYCYKYMYNVYYMFVCIFLINKSIMRAWHMAGWQLDMTIVMPRWFESHGGILIISDKWSPSILSVCQLPKLVGGKLSDIDHNISYISIIIIIISIMCKYCCIISYVYKFLLIMLDLSCWTNKYWTFSITITKYPSIIYI